MATGQVDIPMEAGPGRRLGNLDLLRGIAALAVLAQHLLEKVDPVLFAPVLALAPGVFGVALFFLISGYIIPMSFVPGVSASEFIARRIFRIFPVWLAVLAAVVLLGSGGFEPWHTALRDGGLAGLLANALLVQEYTAHPPLIGVSWTLSLEFVWYGIFLASALVLGRGAAFALTVAGSVGLIGLSILSVVLEQRMPLGRFAMLAAALVGYAVLRASRGDLSRGRARLALVLFLLAVVSAQGVAFGHFTHPKVSLFNALAGWLGAIAVFMAFQGRRDLGARGMGAAGRRIGRISYPLYLVHGPLLLVWGAVVGSAGMLIAVPVLSVALSMVLHRYVEQPGIALGRRFAGRFPRAILAGGPRA